MREFQEKRKIRKALFSRVVLAALFAILIFLSISTAGVYLKSRIAARKNEEMKQKAEELKKRKTDLEKEIARLQSGFGREQELREKFNLRKPGEKTLVIVDKTDKNAGINSKKKSGGFFQKIWQAIKSIF